MKLKVDESLNNLEEFSRFPNCYTVVTPLQIQVLMVRQDALSSLLALRKLRRCHF